MVHGPTRSTLSGPALPALLLRRGLVGAPASVPSALDGLAGWMDWRDAIALSAALQDASGTRPGPTARDAPTDADTRPAKALAPHGPAAAHPHGHEPRGSGSAVGALERQLDELHEALARAIDDVVQPPRPTVPRRAGRTEPALDPDPDVASWRSRYIELQQTMQAATQALRARLRAELAAGSASSRRLAALDATWSEVLTPREQMLLNAMPGLLQLHFERTCPDREGRPSAEAVRSFRADLRALLHAELELRLQPLLGLMEALSGGAARKP